MLMELLLRFHLILLLYQMETNKIEELFANFFNSNKESIPSWTIMLIEVLVNQAKIANNLVNRIQQLEDNKAVNDRVLDEL